MKREFDDTSAALMAAAHEILDKQGPDGLTVRRIASQAGMSTMNVYSRFDGKHGVINELYADGYQRLSDWLESVKTTDDALEDLIELMKAFRAFSLAHRSYYRVMFGSSTVPSFEPSDHAIQLAYRSLFHLAERVERAQQMGQVRVYDDWEPMEIAAWMWSMVHGIVSLEVYQVGTEHISWGEHFERGMRTAFAGIAAESS